MRNKFGQFIKGSKHPKQWYEGNKNRWKGKNAGYHAFHMWLRKYYGKADKCENNECTKKSKRFEYALIKNKRHAHNRKNYIMLCSSCHKKYDMTSKRKKQLIDNMNKIRCLKKV